jgi:flagellar hook protein FlgE
MSIMGASVSGMTADTNWLSSISQNVANSNTTGYKTAETEFSALVDQPSTTSYNASGVATTVTNQNSVQGSIVGASNVTDLAIQGNGYFVVNNSSGTSFLTRDGTFVPDAQGNLVNSSGYYLMGYNTLNGTVNPVANSNGGMTEINVDQAGAQAVPTTAGTLTANLPSDAAVAAGGTTPADNQAGASFTEETSLVAYNNLGGSQTINVYMTNTGPDPTTGNDTWEVTAFDASQATPGATGPFPYTGTSTIPSPLGTSQLVFDPSNGQLISGSPVSLQVPNGQTMSLDMTGTTQLATTYSVSAATTNGNAPGTVTGVQVAPDGTLSFTFSNGSTVAGYDIPLADVPSPDNLTSAFGNAFQTNVESGAPRYGTPGTSGLGTIDSSSLEESTVDLATELTQMIQAQSSYQANSKVFQTGADILDILNNLKS